MTAPVLDGTCLCVGDCCCLDVYGRRVPLTAPAPASAGPVALELVAQWWVSQPPWTLNNEEWLARLEDWDYDALTLMRLVSPGVQRAIQAWRRRAQSEINDAKDEIYRMHEDYYEPYAQ